MDVDLCAILGACIEVVSLNVRARWYFNCHCWDGYRLGFGLGMYT